PLPHLLRRRPPTSTLFPYTTLFRSDDGVVRNAGGTILGADNKSAVVAMLEGLRRVLAENRPHAGIELVFTPKEEVGLIGAKAFEDRKSTRLNSSHVAISYAVFCLKK